MHVEFQEELKILNYLRVMRGEGHSVRHRCTSPIVTPGFRRRMVPMRLVGKVLLFCMLALAGWAGMARAGGEESAKKQFQQLMTEFNETARGLWEAKTDGERMTVAERMIKLSPRMLELAEKAPDDAVAQDCLIQVAGQEIWLENNTKHPGRGAESLEDRAISILLERYLQSPQLGVACQRVSYGFRRECERFLRTVLEKSPHKEVQGLACLRLAQFLNGRMRRFALLEENAEMAKRYEGLFGKEYLDELKRMDRAAVIREVEALFTRAAEEFAAVKLPYNGLVGVTAKSELHEIRHLSVGQKALEIEGDDENGARFKLSDYRGRVVLLYFWSEY